MIYLKHNRSSYQNSGFYKMTYNKWLTQFRREKSERGNLVREMLKNINFPLISKSHFDGSDFLQKNNMNEYAKLYRENYELFRSLPHVNTPEIRRKCSTSRPTSRKKRVN